jgi:hypothetical protein
VDFGFGCFLFARLLRQGNGMRRRSFRCMTVWAKAQSRFAAAKIHPAKTKMSLVPGCIGGANAAVCLFYMLAVAAKNRRDGRQTAVSNKT